MEIELKRNEETGLVEGYKNGEKIGTVITMGDMITKTREDTDFYKKSQKGGMFHEDSI